jgi:hypothetical protein
MAIVKKDVLTALVIDSITGKETVRELTAEEIAERETMLAQAKAKQTEQTAKAAARASALAKLADLGLTEEEIAAL